MKGVFNSEIDPREEFTHGNGGVDMKIWRALEDDEYLVGVLCTHLVRGFKFDPDDPRFAKLTPEYVARILDSASTTFFEAVFDLLQEKNREIEANLFERNLELVEVTQTEDDKQPKPEV